MDRLTGWAGSRAYIRGYPEFYLQPDVRELITKVARKLAAYEDTCLEPDEVLFAIDINGCRERDALLSDLRGKCSVCKHYSGWHNRGKCKECIHEPAVSPLDGEHATQDHWEWRGMKEGSSNEDFV